MFGSITKKAYIKQFANAVRFTFVQGLYYFFDYA